MQGKGLTLLPVAFQEDRAAAHWIALARAAIEHAVLSSPAPKATDPRLSQGVFVTIERDGTILGCRGVLAPTKRTLDEEIVGAAISAAKFDPRYGPVRKAKLDRYLVTVTIVEKLEPISDWSTLRPEEGLVLKSGSKTGVVLPWEGKEAAIRLDWAYRKAGVPRGASVSLMKMIANRYRG